MDGRNEHRLAVKFCFKAGLSVTETPVLVQKAYGNEVLTTQKPVYMPMQLILNQKKKCLPHLSSIFNKNSPKTFGLHCVHSVCNTSHSLLNGFNKNTVYSVNRMTADSGETKYFSFLP